MTKQICILVAIIASVLVTAKATPSEDLTATARYYVSQTNLTFIEAMIDCQTRNMEMARIENETVFTDLSNHLTDLGVFVNNSYWLGGLRRNNGEWMWLETQEVASFTNWGEKQPIIDDDGDDYCIQMGMDYGKNSRTFKWEAQSCEVRRYYICQFSKIPLDPTTTTTPIPTTSTTTTIGPPSPDNLRLPAK